MPPMCAPLPHPQDQGAFLCVVDDSNEHMLSVWDCSRGVKLAEIKVKGLPAWGGPEAPGHGLLAGGMGEVGTQAYTSFPTGLAKGQGGPVSFGFSTCESATRDKCVRYWRGGSGERTPASQVSGGLWGRGVQEDRGAQGLELATSCLLPSEHK